LHGEGLKAWSARPEFARFVLEGAGLRFEPGKPQKWQALGTNLDVSVWAGDERGFHVLRIDGGWPGTAPARRSLSLTQVYWIALCGSLEGLRRKPAQARVTRRALMEAGLVPEPHWRAVALPDGAPPSAVVTWGVVTHLLRVHRLTEPIGEPLPLSVPFLLRWAAGWEGVSESALIYGKKWLGEAGYLTKAGTAEAGGQWGNPVILWRVREHSDEERAVATAEPSVETVEQALLREVEELIAEGVLRDVTDEVLG